MTNYLERKLKQEFSIDQKRRHNHPCASISDQDLKVLDSMFRNIDGENLEVEITDNLRKINQSSQI